MQAVGIDTEFVGLMMALFKTLDYWNYQQWKDGERVEQCIEQQQWKQ